MVEEFRHDGELLALIVRREFHVDGIQFFTTGDFSQQLGYMAHKRGKVIAPHVHNPVAREVHYTQEVLFLRSGRLRVDFYDNAQNYLESRILNGGDVILLATGGHGFEVLEDVAMFEVKQGPYAGDSDKTRFGGISVQDIKLPTT